MLTIHLHVTRPAWRPEGAIGERCFWLRILGLMAFFTWGYPVTREIVTEHETEMEFDGFGG